MKTSRIQSHMDEIAIIGKLADLKDDHYRTTLVLSAVIELLVEKGLLTGQEIADKAAVLEAGDAAHFPG